MAIENVQIATNRYAPSGSEAINMYSNGSGGNLTLSQLVIATCLKTASALETQSVLKMNEIARGSDVLSKASGWMESIVDGTADWTAARNFLVGTLGIASSLLPDNLDTYDRRMQAATALRGKMDVLAQQQQQDMIDLQTTVNRRDVAYSTSSNTVRAIGTSMATGAATI